MGDDVFQKYKYVLAVYQVGSITKAAKQLYISQPSLSVAIRNIEKQIGMPLFERSGSYTRPTEAGLAYMEAAQKMYCAEGEFARKLAEISGLQTGKLVVGGSNYLSSDVLPQIISRFRDQHPGVEIILTEANSLHLRDMLDCEAVDIVIDNFEDASEAYEVYPLTRERVMLCVPVGSAVHSGLEDFRIRPQQIYGTSDHIADIPPVDITRFKNERFILLKDGNDMYHRAMDIFASGAVVPEVVFRVDQLNISYALAESGLGVCFVTDTFFRYRKHLADVVLYKLEHPSASRALHVAFKKGRYCTCAMAEFIKIAQEMIGNK